jgi:hypothetical protein
MKGRYYLDTDFLSTGKSRASSFTWQSLLFGRDLLIKGIQRGIGDGKATNILGDNWIPGHPPGTFSTLEPLSAQAKVSFLLDHSGKY